MTKGLCVWTVLIIAVGVIYSLDVPVVNRDRTGALTVKCARCTFVTQGVYVKTDGNGDVETTFFCNESPAANRFCADPTLRVIPYIEPDYTEVCKHLQPQEKCIASNIIPVTVWGDGRLDTNYEITRGVLPQAVVTVLQQGLLRDMNADTYRFFTPRTQFVPQSPPNITQGPPDVYAWWGSSPVHALFGAGTFFSYDGTNNLDDNVANIPLYDHIGNRLFMYFGQDTKPFADELTSCPTHHHNNLLINGHRCLIAELQEYLSQHRNARMYNTRNLLTASLQWLNYQPAVETTLKTAYEVTADCVGNSCFNNMREDNFRLNITAINWVGRSSAYATFLPGNIRPPVVATDPDDRSGIAYMTTRFITSQGNEIQYPFFYMPRHGVADMNQAGTAQWVEESPDGLNWVPHPETYTQQLRSEWQSTQALMEGFGTALTPENWHSLPGNGFDKTRRVLRNTGKNRFMRIISATAFGRFTNGPLFTGDLSSNWVMPTHILGSQAISPVTMYVFPSLANNVDDVHVFTGQDHCTLLPNCIYFATNRTTYPEDGNFTNFGSATIRMEMSLVLPTVFNCRALLTDPVQIFLDDGVARENICHRFTANPNRLTCYTYSINSRTEEAVNIETDVLNTFVIYAKRGVSLRVSTESSVRLYPVPQMLTGPFTPENVSATGFYIYPEPVIGSKKMESLYVAKQESCVRQPNTTIPSLEITPNCPCLDIPILAAFCLCTNGNQYKAENPVPTGVTFKYPYFFVPQKFPVDYRVGSQQITFDSDAYARINIDCPSFLCSNNAQCQEKFKNSNYVKFCEDQKVIVRTALTSLEQTIRNLDQTIAVAISRVQLPETVDLSTLPPLATATSESNAANQLGSTPNNLKTYSRSLTSFFTRARDVIFSKPFTGAPAGYNYRNPWTTPGQAFGLSIWAPTGIGLLTEKVNSLAYQNSIQDTIQDSMVEYMTGLAKQINELSVDVFNAMQEAFQFSVQLASDFNTAVDQINSQFVVQNAFNKEITETISTFGLQVTEQFNTLADNVNFLDFIGSRANTLNAQIAAVMLRALDREVKARQFEQRVKACSSNARDLSYLCTGSADSQLIGSMVRRQGSVTLIQNLLLEPISYFWAYGAPEFCYKNEHYLVRSVETTFVLLDGVMYVSPKERWAPQNISNINTLRLNGCREPEINVQDLTPTVPIVDIPSNKQITTFIQKEVVLQISLANITAAVLQNISSLNYTNQINALAAAIDNIPTDVAPFVPPTITVPQFDIETGLSTFETVVVVIGVIFGIIVIIIAIYYIQAYCYNGEQKYFKI